MRWTPLHPWRKRFFGLMVRLLAPLHRMFEGAIRGYARACQCPDCNMILLRPLIRDALARFQAEMEQTPTAPGVPVHKAVN
jgi:hypothetical protein